MSRADTDNAGWLPGYRGYVDHGVPTPDYEPEEDNVTPGFVEYEKAEPETPPIPVTIVSDPKPRALTDWRVISTVVSATPQLIMGMNESRKSLKIRNNDATNPVYLAPDSSPTPFLSWRLAPNGEISLSAITDVWAVADTGNTVSVSALVEYEVER